MRKVVAKAAMATALAGGATVGFAGAAYADYGPGTVYQVEMSGSFPHNVFGPGTGGGFWFWFALTPSSPGATSGTADFRGADCIHRTPLGATGSTPDSGSNIPWWTDNSGDLFIGPFSWGGNPSQVAEVPATYGHYDLSIASILGLPFPGSAQLQIAP